MFGLLKAVWHKHRLMDEPQAGLAATGGGVYGASISRSLKDCYILRWRCGGGTVQAVYSMEQVAFCV